MGGQKLETLPQNSIPGIKHVALSQRIHQHANRQNQWVWQSKQQPT